MYEVGKCPEQSGSESQSSPRNIKNFKKSETSTLSQLGRTNPDCSRVPNRVYARL